jgi:alpha-1,6-mannosyltransferase
MKKNYQLVCLILSFLVYGFVFYGFPREQFVTLIICICVLFGCYYGLVKSALDFRWGIAFRLVALLAIPALSDDFYRFIFDGRLVATGQNPYLFLPASFFKTTDYQKFIVDSFIYQKLNSPNYYTVYPPLNQFIFGLAAWLSNKNLWLNVIFLRLIIIAFEAATLYLLNNQFGKKTAQLYAFNPLIIIELTGNLHFEAILIFFLIATLFLLKEELLPLAAISFGLAIGTKLIPLIFLPLIWAEKGWAKTLSFGLIALLLNITLASFFYDKELINNILSSINLYFQKFEFNASVYYLVRSWGYATHGYNIIEKAGFWMQLSSVVGIGSVAILRYLKPTKISFEEAILSTIFVYLLFALTVHPWYVSTVFALSILTKYRFGIAWSALVFLTYHVYRTNAYIENPVFVAIEYGLVFAFLVYEISKNRRVNS